MAEHGSHYERGHMDIREQESTFGLFIGMTKWGSLAVSTGLLFFTLWLCAHAGFFGSLIAAIVVAVVGARILRDKPQARAAH